MKVIDERPYPNTSLNVNQLGYFAPSVKVVSVNEYLTVAK